MNVAYSRVTRPFGAAIVCAPIAHARDGRGINTNIGADTVSYSAISHLRPLSPKTSLHLSLSLLLAFVLVGCASFPKLPSSEVQTIDIQSVEISFRPDANIWWGKAEREYAAMKGAPARSAPPQNASPITTGSLPGDREGDDYREMMDTPEAKQYQRDKLAGLIKDRLGYFVQKYQGSRPVRMEVEVRGFVIPSPLQRVALGGTPLLETTTLLRDANTGEVIGKLDRLAGASAGNGLLGVAVDQVGDDLEDRVLDAYVSNVRTWLGE